MNYLKAVGSEMKKVTWPTFKEVNRFTWIVIAFIIIFGAYFALTDVSFSSLLAWLFSL